MRSTMHTCIVKANWACFVLSFSAPPLNKDKACLQSGIMTLWKSGNIWLLPLIQSHSGFLISEPPFSHSDYMLLKAPFVAPVALPSVPLTTAALLQLPVCCPSLFCLWPHYTSHTSWLSYQNDLTFINIASREEDSCWPVRDTMRVSTCWV